MKEDKSGPAFPTIMRDEDGYVSGRGHGMTLRDYFAAAALQGMIANTSIDRLEPDEFASDAYSYADAMITRREAKS